MIRISKLIDVRFNSIAQRLMVKTTQKLDLSWSAIFSVIVYFKGLGHGLVNNGNAGQDATFFCSFLIS